MLARLLGLPEGRWTMFLSFAIFGLIYFFTLASLSYFIYFKKFRARFHPEYKPNKRELKSTVIWSVLAVVGNAALMMPLHLAIAGNQSKMYYSVADHGWGWLGIQIVLLLLFTETLIYWIHWSLHNVPFLWKHVHSRHHVYKVPTPFVGLAFNPLDAFFQALPHHIAPFIFPVHASVYIASVSLVTLWAVAIHDRITFFRWPWLNYTDHHTLHHWYSNFNLGQYTTFWDRIVGTYRSPEVDRPELPEGLLRRT